uniref:Uncharacterized protein n=1 Tax=Myoviridae sp. ct3Sw5 TaxID=2826609 RepID=A0A8S5MPD5_9CAUD|nr:MAG TPA: hypothetical protein [Myoviridae sp. ct3Sw5]
MINILNQRAAPLWSCSLILFGESRGTKHLRMVEFCKAKT